MKLESISDGDVSTDGEDHGDGIDISESESDGYKTTTVSTSLTLSLSKPKDAGPKYQIQYQERCGRLLVATENIAMGETILIDTPACMGPDNNLKPVCLVCCARLVRGYVVMCDMCGWPLCSDTCRENIGQHHRECSLFQSHGIKFDINDMKTTCPSYNAIMVLRLLWLKTNDPNTWEKIDMLMDHSDENLQNITASDENVITFIRVHCKLSQYSRAQILRVIGIIDTNAYVIGENPNKNVDIQGLFPTCSIINHSCQANTICFSTDDFKFVCRAMVDIRAGEEITTNYLYYQYHFFGNSYRANELFDYWHFRCTCDRCRDPEELGSNVDSVICDQCGQQTMSPGPGPGHYSVVKWTCANVNCDSSKMGQEMALMLDETWNKLEKHNRTNINQQHELLQEILPKFGERHYYVMELKRRILDIIGGERYQYSEVEESLLKDKLSYCEDHLELQSIIAPGLTEYRAYISLHYAETLYWAMVRGVQLDRPSGDLVDLAMEHLDMVTRIWGDYRVGSVERSRMEEAEVIRNQLLAEFDANHGHTKESRNVA